MTREEEIISAARTRAERHQIAEMELYRGDKCNYSYGRIYNSEITSFEAGARWADNHPINVWHDTSEEPVKDTHILIETTIFKDSLEYYSCHWSTLICQSWEKYVKLYNVKRWTYI